MRSSVNAHRSLRSAYSSSRSHLRVRNATISARPVTNSSRLRHCESTVYAAATRSGSRVFQASSAACTLARAPSSSNGGNGGRLGSDTTHILLTGREQLFPEKERGHVFS